MLLVPKHDLAIVFAYVDAGSGVMMLQMLGGALLAGWFYFRRSVAKFAARIVGRDRTAPAGTTSADAN